MAARDVASAQYPTAPSFPLPSHKRYTALEYPFFGIKKNKYPGFVANVDRALDTVGGEDALNKVVSGQTKFAELRYRPKDPYCHPIFGDRQVTSSLLIKVTVPKKQFPSSSSSSSSDASSSSSSSSKSESNVKYNTEIVGIIENTIRFKGLADFQYVPDLRPKRKRAESSLTAPEGAMDNEAELDDKEEEHLHLPPPIFSRTDIPLDYAFRPNPAYKVESEIVDGVMVKRFVSNAHVSTHQFSCVGWKDEVPTQSNREFVPRDPKEKEIFDKLKELFEERPVWSLVALKAKSGVTSSQIFKRTLPVLAYFFEGGPWRKFWVRMGYDPRKDPESRIYQIVDFRIGFPRTAPQHKTPKRLKRGRADLGDAPAAETKGPGRTMDYDPTFTSPPYNNQPRYQLCDINDSNIEALLKKTKPKEICDETNGWFPPKFLKTVRSFMKAKLRVMMGEADAQGLEYFLSGDEEEDNNEKEKQKEKQGEGEKGKEKEVDETIPEVSVDIESQGYLQSLMQTIGAPSQAEDDPFEAYTIFGEDEDEDKDDSGDEDEHHAVQPSVQDGVEMEDDDEAQFFR